MKLALTVAAGALAALMLSGSAEAGCKPACKANQTCRYEAAGDKFYCASSGAKAGAAIGKPGTGGFTQPRTVGQSGSTGRASPGRKLK